MQSCGVPTGGGGGGGVMDEGPQQGGVCFL